MNEFNCTWIKSNIFNTLPVFKKDFVIDQHVTSAHLYVSGLGMFEAYINGKKVHNTYFEPGESVFNKTVYYNKFDVSKFVVSGKNEIMVWLGNGFYYNEENNDNRLNRTPKILGERMFFCNLEINEKSVIKTDETWYCSKSPLTSSNWLGGEVFDDRITFSWEKNAKIADTPKFELKKKFFPSITAHEEIKPVSKIILDNGNVLVDFGRNFAGTYIFTAKAPKDTVVNFYFGEVIDDNNRVNQKDFWGKIYDTYIFGDNEAIYTPKFVYHGFRYIEVEGIKDFNITGIRLHADNKRISILKTDSKIINTIHSIINNSLEDNMQSVLTDCPHREKLGWTEVYQLLFTTYNFNFDLRDYYKKLLLDLADAQNKKGSIPSIVPPFTKGIKVHALKDGEDKTPNDPSWCGAIIFAGYEYYKFYKDKVFLSELYPYMQNYIKYIKSKSADYLLPEENLNRKLGDWMAKDNSSVSFITSCVYYRLFDTMSKIADILGKKNIYTEEKVHIKKAINSKYFKGKYYDSNSQGVNAIALAYGICDEKQAVFKSLLSSVVENNCQLTVGEVALKPLFDMLSGFGRKDIAYKVLINAYAPFTKNKTTLPESWDGKNSQNHAILGEGDSFLFEHIAGISYSAGFEQVELNPYLPDDINYFELSFNSPNGLIEITLERKENIVHCTCKHSANIKVKCSNNIFTEKIS